MTTLNRTNSITRRTAIGGGIVYGLACFDSRSVLVASMAPIASADERGAEANLYAFRSVYPATTVIALTLSESMPDSEVRIHAGSRDWVFNTSGSTDHTLPTFAGKVASGSTEGAYAWDAFVIEVPNGLLAGVERSGIWAERFSARGGRQRIGSPFLAALTMNHSGLARKYHAIRPSQDREAIFEDVAAAVAAEARDTPQTRDALAYGRRLASRLLPDVLHYNPELPQGFSFAARNGRHPGEDAAAIVGTTLNGSPVSSATAKPWRLGNVFPYFLRPSPRA